jgi:hypothetical protein
MGFSLKKLTSALKPKNILNPKNALKSFQAVHDPLGFSIMNKDGKKTIGPAPVAPVSGNPNSQYSYTPGVGYGTGAGGQNPFANVMQSIPPAFFQNPQAMQALQQALGNPGMAPQAGPNVPTPSVNGTGSMGGNNPWAQVMGRVPGTPGPAPSPATLMGRVGGFGNGGGKMILDGKSLIRAK